MGRLIGLVLTGGYSTRMGRDKGLIPHGTSLRFQLAVRLLEPLCYAVYVSMRSEQQAAYSDHITVDAALLDFMEIEGAAGPIRGVLSAHLRFPDDDLFVLPCDLPDMTERVVARLDRESYVAGGRRRSVVARCDGRLEPLCAIYSASFLSRLAVAFASDPRRSMSLWAERLEVCPVDFDASDRASFANYNYPESQ